MACQSSVVPLGDSGPADAGLGPDATQTSDRWDGAIEPRDRGVAPDSGSERPDSAPALRTFTGVVGTEFVDAYASRFEPTDLRTWRVSARAAGRTHPGLGRADGTFSIEAPPGELEVELLPPEPSDAPLLVVTRLDAVDLTRRAG